MRNLAFALLHCAWTTHSELFKMASRLPERLHDACDVPALPNSAPGIAPDRWLEIRDCVRSLDIAKIRRTLESRSVRIIIATDDEYPPGFSEMGSAPFVLYLRGDFPASAMSVSVVGARKCSPYGDSVTREFVRQFASFGWSVVSGGAYGIDRIAHETALENGGSTLAIIGCGIDVDYPLRHREMFDRIAATPGSGVVACFPLGAEPIWYHFPIRNALVAAYSKGTVVIEAAENSGSLITARLALEFNREAFAVPWDVNRPSSAGTNGLIRDGLAKCVITAKDVFSELPNASSFMNAADVSPVPSAPLPKEPVLALLISEGPIHPDVLSERLALSASELSIQLSRFELEGRISFDAAGTCRFVA